MGGIISDGFITRLLYVSKVANLGTPKHCIEAGTYRGDSTVIFASHLDNIITIELSEKWRHISKKRLLPYSNITCHLGDSASIIKNIIPDIKEPILFFLDAHFAGGDTAFGAEEVPLNRELEVLRSRKEKDIIIIDDYRLIGKQGESGKEGDSIYPKMNFDWRTVSMESIEKPLGKGFLNPWLIKNDKIIIFRNLCIYQACIISALVALIKVIDGARGIFKRGN